jgi:hypothetical protein
VVAVAPAGGGDQNLALCGRWVDCRAGEGKVARLCSMVQAEQSRRFAFEESPDITGKGGR